MKGNSCWQKSVTSFAFDLTIAEHRAPQSNNRILNGENSSLYMGSLWCIQLNKITNRKRQYKIMTNDTRLVASKTSCHLFLACNPKQLSSSAQIESITKTDREERWLHRHQHFSTRSTPLASCRNCVWRRDFNIIGHRIHPPWFGRSD